MGLNELKGYDKTFKLPHASVSKLMISDLLSTHNNPLLDGGLLTGAPLNQNLAKTTNLFDHLKIQF
jgi:hypothetical protein